MLEFKAKQGKTGRPITLKCMYDDGSLPDFTGATVRFHMRNGATTLIDADAVILDAEKRIVAYDWTGSDLDTLGTFEAEFEVTYSNLKPECWPVDGFISVIVGESIA